MFIPPQAPAAAKVPPVGELWTHQPKLDGFRCVAVKEGAKVRLYSRRGTEFRLPAMAAALAKLAADTAVLDAELIHVGADGRADFYALLRNMRLGRPNESTMILMAFDHLLQDSVDLRGLPLSERSRDLARLLRKSRVPCVKLIESFPDGAVLLNHCDRLGIEGIVSKRVDRAYVSGQSTGWLKIKCNGWRRRNQRRHELFEKPVKPLAPTERERTLQRKRVELARLQERLIAPDGLRPGLAAAFKAQEKSLLQEITELEAEALRAGTLVAEDQATHCKATNVAKITPMTAASPIAKSWSMRK
jgi:hypothetical protein